ncbi:FlxA-like family protein [Spiroplasma endosymbiont of Asaphidion curtum]|uniref:FlxA-like family protein n=1 Tax=Spiroplasma endosymbiont of Asaphidion curtum TaxID=3066281 RepID=UPI00313E24A1
MIKSNDTVVVIKELAEFESQKTSALKYVKALEDYRVRKEKALNDKLAEKDSQISKLNEQIKIYTKQVKLITDLVATFGKEGSLKELKKVKEEAKFEDQVDHIKAEFERIIKEKTKLNTENEANKQEIKDANEALDALQIAIDTGKEPLKLN